MSNKVGLFYFIFVLFLVLPIRFLLTFFCFYSLILRNFSDYLPQEVDGNGIKQRKNYFSCLFVNCIVKNHQVWDKRRVSIGVSVIGACIFRRIWVYLIVDVSYEGLSFFDILEESNCNNCHHSNKKRDADNLPELVFLNHCFYVL